MHSQQLFYSSVVRTHSLVLKIANLLWLARKFNEAKRVDATYNSDGESRKIENNRLALKAVAAVAQLLGISFMFLLMTRHTCQNGNSTTRRKLAF
jgi:nitric oxide reductase large subunit